MTFRVRISFRVIVHHKDAKDSKTRKESSLKATTFANLGVLCAFAVHKRLYGERLPFREQARSYVDLKGFTRVGASLLAEPEAIRTAFSTRLYQYPRLSPTSFTWMRPFAMCPSMMLHILQIR